MPSVLQDTAVNCDINFRQGLTSQLSPRGKIVDLPKRSQIIDCLKTEEVIWQASVVLQQHSIKVSK